MQNAPRSLAPHYLIFEYGTKNKETDRSTGGKTVWVGSTRPAFPPHFGSSRYPLRRRQVVRRQAS